MNKRVWSIAVALVMLLSMVCSAFVVSATDDVVRILYSSESVSVGDALEATVQLNNYASDWNDPTILLDYDPAVLELVSADTSVFGAEGTYTEEQKGTIKAVWAYQSTENRTAFDAMKLTFKVIGTEGDTSLKATVQVVETVAEATVPFQIKKQIILSQEATPLADDGDTTTSLESAATGGPTTLELTTKVNGVATTEIKPGAKFAVDVSLGNYNGNWAIFAADIFYDASIVDYAEQDSIEFETDDLMVMVDKVEDGKLTITALSLTGDNIEAGSVLATLNFKVKSGNDVTNRDKDGDALYSLFKYKFDGNNIAGYTNEGSEIFESTDETNGFKEGVIVPLEEEQVTITPPTYLSVEMEGDAVQGGKVYATVSLKNYYDPWMAMTLALDYDTSIFEYVGYEDLGAFAVDPDDGGEMILTVAETGDPETPLNINFLSSDLSNRALAGGETSAAILKLEFNVKEYAKVGDTSIDVSFATDLEGGNLKEDSEGSDGYVELDPETDNFVEESVSPAIKVEGTNLPKLVLVDADGNSLDSIDRIKISAGETVDVYVKIVDFAQRWSVMSLFTTFDNNIFEIESVEGGVFGDYATHYVSNNKLGITLFSADGSDVGLVDANGNVVTEGIVAKITLRAVNTPQPGTSVAPVQVSFLPGGNVSDGVTLNDKVDKIYETTIENPAVFDKVVPRGNPEIRIEPVGEVKDVLEAGDEVSFDVFAEDFSAAWTVLTLRLNFDSSIFELVGVTDAEPFDTSKSALEGLAFSNLSTEQEGDNLLACWFNSGDLPMKNPGTQKMLTFTLRVKETYTATGEDVKQSVSAGFLKEGNIAGDVQVPESSYNPDPDKVEIEVEEKAPEQPDEPEPTASVTITWGEMTFTYSYGEWDPANHIWDNAGWTANDAGNWIKVENTGEVNLTATFEFANSYTAENGDTIVTEGLSGVFNGVENAETIEPGEDKAVTVTLELVQSTQPSLELAGSENVRLGTITVTVAVADENNEE